MTGANHATRTNSHAAFPKGITWADLCLRVPELAEMQDECLSIRSQPTGCAVKLWYGYDDGDDGMRGRLGELVGWRSTDSLVRSRAAYELAYRTLYESLPDCAGRCPSCPVATPKAVRTEFARLRATVLVLLIRERGRLCEGCGGYLSKPTIDHIVPVARGGSNHWGNFQLLCRPCNSRKGTS